MLDEAPQTFDFKPLDRSHFVLLGNWLRDNTVERWWREDPEIDAIEERYGPSIDGLDPTRHFMVLFAKEPIGFVQSYRIADNPSWESTLVPTNIPEGLLGMDYLIGAGSFRGRGLGTRLLRTFIHLELQNATSALGIAVAVQQENRPSWRALEKCGFKRFWEGKLESDDPADEGPSFVYLILRTTVVDPR